MSSMQDLYLQAKRRTSPRIKYSRNQKENVTKILATLVPDEIIYLDVHLDSENTEFLYNGVLFFADVSGFTDLCEKYNQLGKGGPSRITQVLNEYIGAMVQEIMSHSGDILKFSGDAFLALWKNTDRSSMTDVAHAAIDCALGIQRSHGQYITEVGITLRVKIALAAGQVIFNVIGDNTFMVLGSTMFDVKDVGNMCSAGETIMSSSLKNFIGLHQYILNPISGTQFIKIMGIGPAWNPSYLNDKYDIFDIVQVNEKPRQSEDTADEISILTLEGEENISYSVRPSLNYAINKNLEDYLRKFIIAPVIRAIDLGEPLEYLTEMRQVVIVFVNVMVKVFQLKQLEVLCDLTYRAICDLVKRVGGCVNKVSMFDKDLMFLCIFGLRGFKHSVEAQRALYCAKKIREKLLTVNQVVSASAGVTTGGTYCGVVGHQLRKEYTVIGRTVNKAARLMCAYPDMVSCDRQTFLQSQLQSRYFKLQPYHYLKGFKNVGPVYQFHDEINEQEVLDAELKQTNTYPLLDRQREMKLFFSILNTKISNSAISLLERKLSSFFDFNFDDADNYNMLIIKGEARQGKTRLLNEFLYYIKGEVASLECTLNMMNSKSFKIFRCLFNNGCELTNEKNMHKRTKNVWRALHPFKAPEFLCGLNEILGVRFHVSNFYLALNPLEKLYVKSKLIKYLIKKIFRYPTVFIIDNIEYMDPESWLLFRQVIESDFIFVCATVHKNMNLSVEALKILDHPKVVISNLNPVHQWYHSGLICQFLNVRGVSLELEKYIQEHSYGNPGWIESFLTTMLDSKGIEIAVFDQTQAYKQGIVMPNLDLLQRAQDKIEAVNKSVVSLIESKLDSFIKLFDVEIEGWDIYEQTVQATHEKITKFQIIPICVLSDTAELDELDTEDFLDVKMLKSYDSLTVQEQQLLKGCSILGNSFERCKLEYVMQNSKQRENAIAIQKLFEIKVLACARGIYNGGAIKVNHFLTDPNENLILECKCEGFPINPLIADLPSYASCGYIRFAEPIFRDMLYHLLTDVQANLYHVRAIWFLESQTRRCRDCGNGYFVNINGQNYDDGMKIYSSERMPITRNTRTIAQLYGNSQNVVRSDVKDIFIGSSAFGYQMGITDEFSKSHMKARTFAEHNLVNCECLEILSTMYTEMIHHSQESEKHEILMYSLLEYAALCIQFHNVTVAFTLLRQAIVLLEGKLKKEFLQAAWQVPITKGRILTLQGQLHIQRGVYMDAETRLLEALKTYNLYMPQTSFGLNLFIKKMEWKLVFILRYFASRYIGSKNNDVCTLAEQTSDALSSLYTIYKITNRYKRAYLTSLWSFTAAIRSDSNFYMLCIAYANIITMNMVYYRPQVIYQIEDMALLMCYKKTGRLEIHELNALIKMYSAIFYRKCICDNMLNYLKLGYIILNLHSPEYGNKYWWPEMPLLIRALLSTLHINQAATYIKIMWDCQANSQVNQDLVYAKMRIAACCLDFKMCTTHSVLPMLEIKKSGGLKKLHTRDIEVVEMQYSVLKWLWHVRKRDWENAIIVYSRIANEANWPIISNHHLAFTYVSLVEGFLLIAVRKLNCRDEERSKTNIESAKSILKQLNDVTMRLKCVRPRYLQMEAYLKMIFKQRQAAFKLLNEAKTLAIACSSSFDIEWIDHNKQEWVKWPKQTLSDAWNEATDVENLNMNWESASTKNFPYFTLRLPDPELC